MNSRLSLRPLLIVCCLFCGVRSAGPEVIDPGHALDQARILIDAGQPDSAREILVPYISSGGPRMDYAEYLLALLSFSDTNPDVPRQAVDHFRRRHPDSRFAPTALFRLGQLYRVTLRDPARSVAVYSQFLLDYPLDILARESHLWMASALIDAGQYDRAIAAIHQALAIYEYDKQEKKILDGLLDFAKQSTGQQPAGGITIDVQAPPQEPPTSALPADRESVAAAPEPIQPDGISFPATPPPADALPPRPAAREGVWTAVTGTPLPMPETTPSVLMNYRDAEIDDVLNVLSEELGLTFIKDDEVQGKITIINPRKMTPAEAVYLLESILELKGFAMVRSGHVFKILPAQKSYTKGLDVYASQEQSPQDDRPVTRIIRLNNALVQDVVNILQPLLGDAGSIAADVSKNSIVVTGMASNIYRMETIVRTIDQSGATDQREAFRLKFLSAAEALPLVQKLLATTQPENLGALKLVTGPTPVYLFGIGPLEMIFKVRDILKMIDVPGYKEESLKVYTLKEANAEKLAAFLETLMAKGLAGSVEGAPTRPGVVSADRITNSIVVLGSRAFHDVISPLIEKLDYEGFSAFRVSVIPLKYAGAPDLATKFENIVARGLGPRGEAYSNQILIQAEARLNALIIASASQSLLKTMASLASALDVPSEEGGPRTVVYYLENADASKLETVLKDIFTKNEAPVIQPAKIVADKGTNSLVIIAMRENYDAVMETVMKLDIAPYQVLVEAIILEVTLDESTDLGVDWTWKHSNVDFDLRSTSAASIEALSLTGLKQAIVKDKNQLNALVNALVANSRTRVLATPRIFAANNQEASIVIGDEVPVKTGSSTTTGGVTQNTFEYKDVGITLKVTPHINRKRQTVLDISQEIKSIRATSTSTENPTFTTREAKTNAVLGDAQTVIIAGLIRTDRTMQESKVPIFGDLPLFGAAFRKRKETDIRTELMIFITPTVVESEAEMAAAINAQKKAVEKAGFGPMNLDADTPSQPKFIQDFILK